MGNRSYEKMVRDVFALADVAVNGSRPWDIQVKDDRFYRDLAVGGSLALGESYMDDWWDCQALDRFFERILACRVDQKTRPSLKIIWCSLKAWFAGSPGRRRAFEIGLRHYDIGNELFALMLDKWMNYSCGYWKGAKDLDQAQKAKMDLICRKLCLEPGMRVLDIGCGWGGLAAYMAEHYQVEVRGITVSQEQAALARERCRDLPVDIRLTDYRELTDQFDRIVSVGMFEHVGQKNYRKFMAVVRRCLLAQGLFLLHTIGGNRSLKSCDPWISQYIFPNSMVPSSRQISSAAEKLLVLEDWHSFGPDYDPTLMAWHRNFINNWACIKSNYDHRFFRMWSYYLLACAGTFRSRRNQLWQVVFSRDGLRPRYESVR
ncbi:MAG: cyclopropane fatty acyl phospholipid synthase [Desulfobacter sp.]|nr:cyclopropane fatty acyl phospholipid synthase [Desulfobacter sp.]